MLCYAMLFCASISCVYLVRLFCSSWFVSSVSVHLSCLFYASVSSRFVSSVLCVCLVCSARLARLVHILPPEQFKRFDPFDPFQIFQAFDSYNYLSNSSGSIGSNCLPPRALRRVKINFFKLVEIPEWFEVFNSIETFGVYGVYGEYGEIKGVRSVRGNCSYNPLREFIYSYSCTYRP